MLNLFGSFASLTTTFEDFTSPFDLNITSTMSPFFKKWSTSVVKDSLPSWLITSTYDRLL